MNARRKLVLVDGSGYLYRAFHALPPLHEFARRADRRRARRAQHAAEAVQGRIAGADRGRVRCAGHARFATSCSSNTRRQRTPMPDDLRSQLQPLLDCVEAMGLPLLRIDGVEADDVIGTLAKQAAAQDIDVLISTGDKDMAQLVNERITLVNTMTGSRLDRARREEQVRCLSRTDRSTTSRWSATPSTTFRASPKSGRRPPRNG